MAVERIDIEVDIEVDITYSIIMERRGDGGV